MYYFRLWKSANEQHSPDTFERFVAYDLFICLTVLEMDVLKNPFTIAASTFNISPLREIVHGILDDLTCSVTVVPRFCLKVSAGDECILSVTWLEVSLEINLFFISKSRILCMKLDMYSDLNVFISSSATNSSRKRRKFMSSCIPPHSPQEAFTTPVKRLSSWAVWIVISTVPLRKKKEDYLDHLAILPSCNTV